MRQIVQLTALYKLLLVYSKMQTQNLILLKRSVDLIILRSLLNDINPQHFRTAVLIHTTYKSIFQEINTAGVIWEIKHKYWYGWYESILVITKNKTEDSTIIISAMINTAENPFITFNGPLFDSVPLNWNEFKKEIDQREYLKGIIRERA